MLATDVEKNFANLKSAPPEIEKFSRLMYILTTLWPCLKGCRLKEIHKWFCAGTRGKYYFCILWAPGHQISTASGLCNVWHRTGHHKSKNVRLHFEKNLVDFLRVGGLQSTVELFFSIKTYWLFYSINTISNSRPLPLFYIYKDGCYQKEP